MKEQPHAFEAHALKAHADCLCMQSAAESVSCMAHGKKLMSLHVKGLDGCDAAGHGAAAERRWQETSLKNKS